MPWDSSSLRAATVFLGVSLWVVASFDGILRAKKFGALGMPKGHILKRGDQMAEAQREVLQVLLKSLYDRGLLTKATYDRAVNMVNSNIDLPEFFWYPVCCQRKEDEENGCTKNQK